MQLPEEQQLAFDLGSLPPQLIPALWSVEDIYTHANTRVFKTLKEDRRIERKSANVNARTLGDYFSMWSNTPEGGILVVGIENDGAITGLRNFSETIINEIEDCPRVYCPDAKSESRRVQVENNRGNVDYVIVFWVQYRKDKVVTRELLGMKPLLMRVSTDHII